MRVLMAAAEFSPLVRTGGLGDAVAGLSHALRAAGVDTTIVIPRYRSLAGVGVAGPGAGPAGAVYAHDEAGVTVLLVDDPAAFDRDGVYGPGLGVAYEDEWLRWGRFAQAVAALAEDFDLVHLHDAHAGAAALLTDRPTVFTIHNAAYPVLGPLSDVLDQLGLGPQFALPGTALEWYGEANYLKAGLVGATQATTVSPGFALQLGWDDEVSSGLDGVIRYLPRPLVGIMNGIDTERFDPATDTVVPARFSAAAMKGRRKARPVLVKATGIDPDGLIFGMVGRVSPQKGFELIDEVMDGLVDDGLRLIVVGNGELDPLVDGWAKQHSGAVVHRPFDEAFARLTWAGADAYLMPSLFEPGGLGNLYAMRYGCPPLVRLTGGLADTVIDIDEDPRNGNGFGFRTYDSAVLAKTVRRAIRYRHAFSDLWETMQRNGMSADWSWGRAAAEYRDLYRRVAE